MPIGGGAGVKLNGLLPAGGNVDYSGFAISPDSARVVYSADQQTDEVYELFSVPIGGGPVTKLNGPLTAGGGAYRPAISPDSTRVVYIADQQVNDVWELFSVPIAGGTVTRLSGPMTAEGDVLGDSPAISPDSHRVAYIADQETVGTLELFVTFDDTILHPPIFIPLVRR